MPDTFTFTRGTTSIEFDASVLPINLTFQRDTDRAVSEDGTVYVYDPGFEEIFYALKVSTERSNSTYADITNVRDFIRNETRFGIDTFQIDPPDDIDLGDGDGVEVTVRYWSNTLEEIQGQTQIYEYDFFLRKEL